MTSEGRNASSRLKIAPPKFQIYKALDMRAMIPRAIANTSDLEGLFANIVPYVKKKNPLSVSFFFHLQP